MLMLLLCFVCVAANNVIIFMADDMGINDISYRYNLKNNNAFVLTPFINSLDAIYYNHVWGASVCAPSRQMVYSGIETYKSPIKGNKFNYADVNNKFLVDLQSQKYTTIISGKYGFGSNTTGFDKSFILQTHEEAHYLFPKYAYLENKRIALDASKTFDSRSLEYTIDMINQHRHKKFILFDMTMYGHVNKLSNRFGYYVDNYEGIIQANRDLRGYMAMIRKFDNRVKTVYDFLEKNDLLEKTIIIITADNGMERFYESGRPTNRDPLKSTGHRKGKKRSMYEGGLNVPFIVYQKGKTELSENNTPFTFARIGSLINNFNIPKEPYVISEYCDHSCNYAVLDTETFDKLVCTNNRCELYNLKRDPFEKVRIDNIAKINHLKSVFKNS